jgi:hypothetical protein
LAELYEAAVALMLSALPGRLRLVGHSVREIANRLPDYLGGQVDGGRLDYKRHVDDLSRRWREAGVAFEEIRGDDTSSLGPDADAVVTIPVHVYRQIGRLILAHESASQRSEDKTVRLFTLVAPESGPHIESLRPAFKQWNDCRGWFQGIAHDPGPKGSAETRAKREAELKDQFDMFESVLASLVGSFYRNVSELDDILGEANQPSD